MKTGQLNEGLPAGRGNVELGSTAAVHNLRRAQPLCLNQWKFNGSFEPGGCANRCSAACTPWRTTWATSCARSLCSTKRGDRYADCRIRAGFAFDRHICYATGDREWSSRESQLRRFRRSKPCFLRHRFIIEGQYPLIPRSPPLRDRGEDYG